MVDPRSYCFHKLNFVRKMHVHADSLVLIYLRYRINFIYAVLVAHGVNFFDSVFPFPSFFLEHP